jgi:hypothetical protein
VEDPWFTELLGSHLDYIFEGDDSAGAQEARCVAANTALWFLEELIKRGHIKRT